MHTERIELGNGRKYTVVMGPEEFIISTNSHDMHVKECFDAVTGRHVLTRVSLDNRGTTVTAFVEKTSRRVHFLPFKGRRSLLDRLMGVSKDYSECLDILSSLISQRKGLL